jgi:DNA repair protein RecO
MSINTEIVIIRKYPYKDSSMIVAGLTPEFGKISLIIKGAFRKNNTNMPVIDLFRVLEVSLKKNNERDLHSIYKASLLKEYDDIALTLNNYNEACRISSFIFSNTRPFVSTVGTYKALIQAFEGLSEKRKSAIPWYMLVKLAFLYDNGFLPEVENDDSGRQELLHSLLLASTGFDLFPDISPEYLEVFSAWIDNLCRYHDLGI